MKLPGWSYIAVGLLVGLLSGYTYLFIPKNGEKNLSMAFFFFVGMVFILVGFVKTLFKKMDAEEEVKLANIKPATEVPHRNRIEEQLYRMGQSQHQGQHTQHHQTQHPTHHQTTQHHTQHQTAQHAPHSSHYAKTHPYHGVTETTKPAAHHTPQQATQTQQIITCKCGTKNYNTSNYCHKCGHGLK